MNFREAEQPERELTKRCPKNGPNFAYGSAARGAKRGSLRRFIGRIHARIELNYPRFAQNCFSRAQNDGGSGGLGLARRIGAGYILGVFGQGAIDKGD